MTKQTLNFIAIARFDKNYDPLLGRNVFEDNDDKLNDGPINSTGSVFDDPDLDFTYVAPITPQPNTIEQTEKPFVNDELQEIVISASEPQSRFGIAKEEIEEQDIPQDNAHASDEIKADEEIIDNFLSDDNHNSNAAQMEIETTSDTISFEIESNPSESMDFEEPKKEEYDTLNNDGKIIETNADIEIIAQEQTPNTNSEIDLFAPKPESEKPTQFDNLFGSILAGGVKRIRNFGPILGKKGENFINLGPILASDNSKNNQDSNDLVDSKVFNEPIFAQKEPISFNESPVFGEPIFAKKPDKANLQGDELEGDENSINFWPPIAKKEKIANNSNDIATNIEEDMSHEIDKAQDVNVSEKEAIEGFSNFNDETAPEQLHLQPIQPNEKTDELINSVENTDDSSDYAQTEYSDNLENDQQVIEAEIKDIEEPSFADNYTLSNSDEANSLEANTLDVGQKHIDSDNIDIAPNQDKTFAETPEVSAENESEAEEENLKTRGDILREKYRQAKRQEHREKMRKDALKAKQKKKKSNPLLLLVAIFFTGTFAMLTIAAMLAPLGTPFDAISFAKWYIATLGLASVLIWVSMRNWLISIVSGLLLVFNLMSFVPSLGGAPRGGKADKTIGWVDLNNSAPAFEKIVNDAENNGTDILFLARANLTQIPANWVLLQAPIRNDPNSITILSKGNWAAATLTGEPTMARLLDNSITIIAVNPADPSKSKEKQADRESMINRAAARAGTQETPVIALGNFDEPSWSRQMVGFSQNGQVRRVRCGGYFGATLNNGLFNLAPDHVFTRGLIVSKCNIGGAMPNGAHRAIWLSVRAESANTK